jgi:hypothetical protein
LTAYFIYHFKTTDSIFSSLFSLFSFFPKMNACTIVGIILPRLVEEDGEYYMFEIYDVCDGHFVYKAKVARGSYEAEQSKMRLGLPRYVMVSGVLRDVPMMQDFLGMVNEARQVLEAWQICILPSDISIPENSVDIVAPTVAPLEFSPGPMEGYYIIRMNPDGPASTFQAREPAATTMEDVEEDNYADEAMDDMDEQEHEEEEDEQAIIDRLMASLVSSPPPPPTTNRTFITVPAATAAATTTAPTPPTVATAASGTPVAKAPSMTPAAPTSPTAIAAPRTARTPTTANTTITAITTTAPTTPTTIAAPATAAVIDPIIAPATAASALTATPAPTAHTPPTAPIAPATGSSNTPGPSSGSRKRTSGESSSAVKKKKEQKAQDNQDILQFFKKLDKSKN